ncbi:hypothetical protein G7K71_02675 [Desulfofundulus sp. TPOSR]|uniref:stalk domain-containing protein n=1 Tax=Desulfofundulus sp. TPOSR TaxID=2714340 RepID=UPI00140CDD0C|nr:stalk domain-containing protein [Desulfofundulus sp. TPOSR]NHM25930.1 hypothetical protein [Desulfofundulus sp. TPOSR]
MRRILVFLGTMLGVFVICLMFAWKAEAAIEVAKFIVGEKSYYVKGKQYNMDVAPFIDANGRVQVPVRFLAYSIGIPENGISFEIPPGYSNDQGMVALTKGNVTMRLSAGSKTFGVVGAYGWGLEEMDTAPVSYNGRVFLPARYVANVFGYEVKWNALGNAVEILDFSNDPPLYETAVATPTRLEEGVYNYLEKRLTPLQLKGAQVGDGAITELNSKTNEVTIELQRAIDPLLVNKKITLQVDNDSVLIVNNYDITGIITNIADMFETGQQVSVWFKENRILAIEKVGVISSPRLYGEVLQAKPDELIIKIIRYYVAPNDKVIQKIEEKRYGVYYNIGRRIVLRPSKWTTIRKGDQILYPPNWMVSPPPPKFSFDLTKVFRPGMTINILATFGILENIDFE